MTDLTKDTAGKIDSKQTDIKVKRFIRVPKGTRIQKGTVPGNEYGGVGGAPEIILIDGLPAGSVIGDQKIS